MWDQIVVVILFLIIAAQSRGLTRMSRNMAEIYSLLGNHEKTIGWGRIAGHAYLLQVAWTVWFVVYLITLAWRYYRG